MTLLATPSIDGARAYRWQPQEPVTPTPGTAPPVPGTAAYRPEPSYHPGIPPVSGPGGTPQPGPTTRPYGAGEFSSYVSGTQARELDVDFMRMSYATYADGPQTVPGWTEVSQAELEAMGWNPDVHLDVPGSQFRAEVFTDGQGNYVLAYRGTQGQGNLLTDPDWQTNYAQGAGQYTDEFDRLAPQVAQEFKATLAQYNGGEVSNLAITGHSQGGGLATVGSIVTGIPAVTFDASGVHPNTFARLGLDIEAARTVAAGGQIRRYSMFEDMLTQLQQAFPPTAPLMPDALGAPIVVRPEGELDRGMVARALQYAGAPSWLSPDLVDRIPIVRNLLRAAISHEQQIMIDTMLQQQPWQAGYQNPTTPIREMIDSLPDAMQDDFARNVSNLVNDYQAVAGNEFARGDYLQGIVKLIGDLGEGFWNSVGDTIDGYADAGADAIEQGSTDLADDIRDNGWGLPGDWLANTVDGGGTLLAQGVDRVGDGAEVVTDVIGQGVETGFDIVSGWFGR